MGQMVRKHFLLPRDVAEEFERVAGQRRQSEQLSAIIRLWLKNQRLLDVVGRHAGFVTAEDHPEWATDEDVSGWVRRLRASDWERQGALSLAEESGEAGREP